MDPLAGKHYCDRKWVVEEAWGEVARLCLLISEVPDIQLLLHSTPMLPGPIPSPPCFTQYTLSLSPPQKLQGRPVVEYEPGHKVWLGHSLILILPDTQHVFNLMPFFSPVSRLGYHHDSFLAYNTGHKVEHFQMAPTGKLLYVGKLWIFKNLEKQKGVSDYLISSASW